MSQSEDFDGDLPPIDPDLAAWLTSDPAPSMPAEVWDRIEAHLAQEPPLGSAQVVDLSAERTRRRGRRVLPVLVGAAGVALVGAVVLPSLRSADPAPVAEGARSSQPVVAAPAPSTEQQDAETASTPTAAPTSTPSPVTPDGAAATVTQPVVPRTMVATGTDYTLDAMPAQVVTLLAGAGMADGAAVASAMSASASPTDMPGPGLAASPEALADCLTRLGLPAGAVPLLLDTATIDGRDGSVIVTAGELTPEGAPATLHVVAVGQECTPDDVLAARHWDLPLR